MITLGIIGIVAALTMPSLISKYQKKVLVTQLQKAKSTWENGLRKMMADEGVSRFEHTAFAEIGWNSSGYYDYNTSENSPEFNNILKKYFNILTTEPNERTIKWLGSKITDPERKLSFIALSDGTHVAMTEAMVYIDVNGLKGPNTLGRDVFDFAIMSAGYLLPQCGLRDEAFCYWKEGYLQGIACGYEGSSDVSMAYGTGCANRIMENGWVMDY